MDQLPTNPFETSLHIGTITQINPTTAKANLPWASLSTAKQEIGGRIGCGEVGEFVFIETERYAIFGRITDVRLPDIERLSVEEKFGKKIESHPIGFIQILSAIDLLKRSVCSGIPVHPRLGTKVYSAHPNLVSWMIDGGDQNGIHIDLATLPNSSQARVRLKPKHLFGRHCAVLGATGGGKSYTLAQLVQSIDKVGGKVILFDPSGEFSELGENAEHYCIGGKVDGCEEVAFPYRNLVERDLFAIFQPSAGSQTPKFREAIKSLKLVNCEPELANNGILVKKNQPKQPVWEALARCSLTLSQPIADFDVSKLVDQIQQECLYPSANYGKDPSRWGDVSAQDYGYCVSLIARIEAIIAADSLSCIFKPGDRPSIVDKIEQFINGDKRVLRISLENLSFEFNARELIANALGRSLMQMARKSMFINNPLVVILDEAHQFLNKQVGDELNKVSLDAFGLIAKEGRKYSLTTIIATQRPRDIPEDVLSQMGTLIVHRLVNNRDREVVERACGDIDKSASAFLPTLAQGEALVVGVDFPIPMSVKVNLAATPPKSKDADYDKYWGN